jgi:glycosyltransferase involved in cell wall biosynthesis
MKAVSVVIPTAEEPDFLEFALRSVARQSAVQEIEEVIVSENKSDTRSRLACERFPQLPIRYVMQTPPLTMVQNFYFLISEARADHVAFLCDDDWWGPRHLQDGLSGLIDHPNAVGWFASSFFCESEVPVRGWIVRPPALWLAAGKPNLTEVWALTPDQVLAVSWVITPFHLSSMVLRRAPATTALSPLLEVHPYQIDRTFYTELASFGDLLYEPSPDTFVRWRPGNVTLRTARDEREAAFRACTARVWAAATSRGLDLAATWHRHVRGADAAVRADLAKNFCRAMDNGMLTRLGFSDFIPPNRYVRVVKRVFQLGNSAVSKATQ